MSLMHIELPDELAGELHRMVQAGWFQTEQEVIRFALVEFIRRHRLTLSEQFQREDIAWALTQAQQKRTEQQHGS